MLFFTSPHGHKKASSSHLQVSCLGAGNYTYQPPSKVLGLILSFRRFLFLKKSHIFRHTTDNKRHLRIPPFPDMTFFVTKLSLVFGFVAPPHSWNLPERTSRSLARHRPHTRRHSHWHPFRHARGPGHHGRLLRNK